MRRERETKYECAIEQHHCIIRYVNYLSSLTICNDLDTHRYKRKNTTSLSSRRRRKRFCRDWAPAASSSSSTDREKNEDDGMIFVLTIWCQKKKIVWSSSKISTNSISMNISCFIIVMIEMMHCIYLSSAHDRILLASSISNRFCSSSNKCHFRKILEEIFFSVDDQVSPSSSFPHSLFFLFLLPFDRQCWSRKHREILTERKSARADVEII